MINAQCNISTYLQYLLYIDYDDCDHIVITELHMLLEKYIIITGQNNLIYQVIKTLLNISLHLVPNRQLFVVFNIVIGTCIMLINNFLYVKNTRCPLENKTILPDIPQCFQIRC